MRSSSERMVGILGKPSTTYFVVRDTQSKHFHARYGPKGAHFAAVGGAAESAVIIELGENAKKEGAPRRPCARNEGSQKGSRLL